LYKNVEIEPNLNSPRYGHLPAGNRRTGPKQRRGYHPSLEEEIEKQLQQML
jgi:hypothetical protein